MDALAPSEFTATALTAIKPCGVETAEQRLIDAQPSPLTIPSADRQNVLHLQCCPAHSQTRSTNAHLPTGDIAPTVDRNMDVCGCSTRLTPETTHAKHCASKMLR